MPEIKWLPADEASGDLRLKIPAGQETVTLQILVGELGEDQTQDAFAALVKSASTKQLTELTKGGPARWAGNTRGIAHEGESRPAPE